MKLEVGMRKTIGFLHKVVNCSQTVIKFHLKLNLIKINTSIAK